MKNKISALWSWLIECKVAIACLLVVYLAIHLGFVTWNSEASIRISGLGLQIIGMTFAIRGLLAIREHFGQPLLRDISIEWLKRFPLRNRIVNIHGNALIATSASLKGYAEAWTPDKPDKNVEDRISDIVRNLDSLRAVQRNDHKAIDELKNDHKNYKKVIDEQTDQLESNIKSDLETLHTSDITTSLVGLIWITVGITFSTVAPELHDLFN